MLHERTTDPIDAPSYNNTTDTEPVGARTALSAYPSRTPTLTSAPVIISAATAGKGRGVFATRAIPAGEVIEISPVLCIPAKEYYDGVDRSVLSGYVFTWKGIEGGMALALGLGSMFNHSATPNVSFILSYSTYTIQYRTFRDVEAGVELCIYYGHDVRFPGDESPIPRATEVDDGWGGLGGLRGDLASSEAESNETRVEELSFPEIGKDADEEMVPLDDLPWRRITDLVNPEEAVLTTFDCWVIDMPARDVQIAFQFVRDHSIDYDLLRHLKRTRKCDDPLTITVLLFPVSASPPDIPSLLAASPLASYNVPLYKVGVPTVLARTEAQLQEWTEKAWPVSYVPIREGPKAHPPKSAGWLRTKKEWIDREVAKVWRAAEEAGQRGEHPIAVTVTDSYDSMSHDSTRLPKTLVRSFDTRVTTGNVLSHAASNAVDAVAVLDRQNLRDPALQPHLPSPYLLTGLTVFMTHEPCLLCSMSLLHSRITQLYFVKRANGSGGCGSVYSVHEDGGLNHKFEVFEWTGSASPLTARVGNGLDLELDP